MNSAAERVYETGKKINKVAKALRYKYVLEKQSKF